jgi:hypothetical protein
MRGVVRRLALLLLAASALSLAACAEPPPPGVDPVAYEHALRVCKAKARVVAEQIAKFEGFSSGTDLDFETVDPCMRSMGFPPPPY